MPVDDWYEVDWSLIDFEDKEGAAKAAPTVTGTEPPRKRRGRPPKVRIDDGNTARIA
jgi:hypothetical protein